MTESQVVDSPRGWVNRHIKEYVATGGRKGHRWKGAPTLLLTTTGRKSGLRRRTALIYGEDGDAYVVVASSGGQAEHPKWYTNLEADPHVEVQVRDEVFPAVARTAGGEERERLWAMMAEIWPEYLNYQRKAPREIPVVVLDRAA